MCVFPDFPLDPKGPRGQKPLCHTRRVYGFHLECPGKKNHKIVENLSVVVSCYSMDVGSNTCAKVTSLCSELSS